MKEPGWLLHIQNNTLTHKHHEKRTNLEQDFTLDEITITNAHRSDVLSNMTVGEYKAAKKAKESRIICIKSHKTADTHGPTLYSYLQIYVNKMQRANVFLSWTDAKLEAGQTSTAIILRVKREGSKGTSHPLCFESVLSHMCTLHIKK